MYRELIEIAKKIVEIANTRTKNEIIKDEIITLSDIDYSEDPYSEQIYNILMELNLEQIISLQTIMYLGRDKDYNSDLTSEEIFLDYKRYIESLGIKTKKLEINQIVEKRPLGKYISKGYEILGITL